MRRSRVYTLRLNKERVKFISNISAGVRIKHHNTVLVILASRAHLTLSIDVQMRIRAIEHRFLNMRRDCSRYNQCWLTFGFLLEASR